MPNYPLGEPTKTSQKVAAWVIVLVCLVVIAVVAFGFILLLRWAKSPGHI